MAGPIELLARQHARVGERHGRRAQVHETIDQPDRHPRVPRAPEVHARRPGEHAVDADHRHRQQHDQPADDGGLVQEDQRQGARHQHAVEEAGHRPAARLEQVVRDGAGKHAAGDAGDAQQQTPVLVHSGRLQPQRAVGLLGEGAEPLHDGLPQEAAAELDAGDGHDDRIAQHHPEHARRVELRTGVPVRGIAQGDIGQAGLARQVAHAQQIDQPEGQQHERGHEEDPDQAQVLEDQVAPVVGEVDAERDEDAEDGAEHAALAHVEPGRVHLDDGHGAEALEIHVHGVEPGENRDEVAGEEGGTGALGQQAPGDQAHRHVGHRRPESPGQDRETAAQPVGQRPVDDERETVDDRADPEDQAEGVVAHQGAAAHRRQVLEGGLGHGEVVAAHVEERVRQPQGQPVRPTARQEGGAVAEFDLRQPRQHERDHDQQPDDPGQFGQPSGHVSSRRSGGRGPAAAVSVVRAFEHTRPAAGGPVRRRDSSRGAVSPAAGSPPA